MSFWCFPFLCDNNVENKLAAREHVFGFHIFKLYLINRKLHTERLKRVLERITKALPELSLSIIEAVDSPEEINDMTSKSPLCVKNDTPRQHLLNLGRGGCILSHLKALHQFTHDCSEVHSSSMPYAMVVEDDVLFHKEFKGRLKEAFCVFNKANSSLSLMMPTLILLSAFVNSKFDFSNFKRYLEGKNQYKYLPILPIKKQVESTACYLISLPYAKQIVKEKYRVPLKNWKNIPHDFYWTSEFISQESKGFFVWPPIVAEESIDSSVSGDLPEKFQYWARFGWHNFVESNDPLLTKWVELHYTFT